MSSRLPRRTGATVLVGALVATLLTGCATTSSALDGAATAELTRSTAIRCAGDAAMKPKRASTVAYASLPGSTFATRAAQADGRILRLGTGTLRLRNFTPAAGTIDGGVLGSATGGIIGRGATRSVIAMVPHSSTHGRDVPKASPRTNQLSVLRVTGTARVLRGFSLVATPQGHLYNGLRTDRVENLRASHIRVSGIPGNDHQPPGETFGINDYRTVGAKWSHIVADGRGVGGSGFGANGSRNITICAASARNNRYGMGFAFWQTKNIRLVDCTARNNGFAGFNFERTSGRVVMIRPVARGNGYDMRIASDRSSAKFRIVDPKLVHGVWTVSMPKRWYTANKQKRSDITLIVHGKRRPDLLRFVSY